MFFLKTFLNKIAFYLNAKGDSRRSRTFAVIMAFCLLGERALQASPSESQIKALFLYNFTKYVDWPSSRFSSGSSPLIIGVFGDSDIEGTLQDAVKDKIVNGHPIVVQHISSTNEVAGCAILFTSASEESNFTSILSKTSDYPILTVGEDDMFLDKGGIINFVLRDGKVHIDVNLRMARKANLSISSELLGIADHVTN